MNVVDVYYAGGFGVMGWVPASEYYGASPDQLAGSAMGIIQRMNADHADPAYQDIRWNGGSRSGHDFSGPSVL